MIETIPVVILAGGQGRRIGGRKPEQQLAGSTLLSRAVARANGYSSIVALSVGADWEQPQSNVAMLRDDGQAHGPIAGLMAALEFATVHDARHVMIMPCDTPFLPEELLSRLRGAIGDAAAAVASYDGQLHSACSLWRTNTTELLPAYLLEGRRSLVGFAERAGYVAVEWPVSDADPFLNINTAEDLARAERMLAPK